MSTRFTILAGIIVGTLAATAQEPPVMGGWAPASITHPEVTAAAHFAIQSASESESAPIELLEIREASQQVVAGVDYKLKLRVERDKQPMEADAIVWWQPWREPDSYQLTSWRWVEDGGNP